MSRSERVARVLSSLVLLVYTGISAPALADVSLVLALVAPIVVGFIIGWFILGPAIFD